MNRRLLIGVAALIVSLVLYTYFSFAGSTTYSIPDDSLSWVSTFARKSSSIEKFCETFPGGCPWVLKSIYYAASISAVSSTFLTLTGAILLIIASFTIYTYVFENPVVSGFSTILLSTVPVVFYWFKASNYGFQTWMFLPVLTLLLTIIYVSTGRRAVLIAVPLVYGLSLILYPGAWALSVIMGFSISIALISGRERKRYIYVLVSWITSYVIPLMFFGFEYLQSICTLGLIWLLTALALVLLLERRVGKPGSILFTTSSAIIYTAAMSIFLVRSGLAAGYQEVFSRRFNPVMDYGILGILSLMSLIVFLRSQILASRVFEKTLFPIGFLSGLVLPYFDPTLTVLAGFFVAPLVGIGLTAVALSSTNIVNFKRKVFFTILSLTILAGSVGVNVLYSSSIMAAKPNLYMSDVDVYLGIGEKLLNESAWIEALDSLRDTVSSSNNSVLIVSYWDYSWWILGYLGDVRDVKMLSNPLSSLEYKRLTSWILLSDELTAVEILKNISSSLNFTTAYVVVTGAISISLTGGRSNNAYLGAVVPGEQNYYGMPTVYYGAVGDLYRIPLYASLINMSYLEYINTGVGRTVYEVPLAWNSKGAETLISSLTIHGLSQVGFNVYNILYSQEKLSSATRYFELINASVKPVYKVSVSYLTYEVNYVVLIYRLDVSSLD
ncbi:MAG: hypothetical protein QXP68_04010 [Thermosphaera sp.]